MQRVKLPPPCHVRFVLCCSLALALPSPARAGSVERGVPTTDSGPTGLVVVLVDRPQERHLDLGVLSNPYMSGAALQIHWSDIEPAEGKYDWSKLDELFATAQSSKKWVQLLIFAGFFTPAWALEGVKTDQFALQYGPGKGTMAALPMPWDKVYLGRWFAFLKQLSARYGNSPAFRVVAAAGPTSVSAEYTLPNSPADLRQWQADSYTPSKYLAAWRDVFQTYAACFPNQYVSLSVGGGLSIDDGGKIDFHEHERTMRAVIDEAMHALAHRLVLQSSDVHAGPGPHTDNSEASDAYILAYTGRVVTGFQMKTSAERASKAMGADGDPSLALKRSIDLALQTNPAGQHVDYLEFYEPDVVADDTQEDLRAAAAAFVPTAAARPPVRGAVSGGLGATPLKLVKP
jgi:hypothetical protein